MKIGIPDRKKFWEEVHYHANICGKLTLFEDDKEFKEVLDRYKKRYKNHNIVILYDPNTFVPFLKDLNL